MAREQSDELSTNALVKLMSSVLYITVSLSLGNLQLSHAHPFHNNNKTQVWVISYHGNN